MIRKKKRMRQQGLLWQVLQHEDSRKKEKKDADKTEEIARHLERIDSQDHMQQTDEDDAALCPKGLL